MAIDIYLRIPTDPNYDPTQIDGDDEFQQFLQLIEMLLTTKKGEVLGNPELGCNLEQFLWNDQISSSSVKTEIMTQILSYGSDYGYRISYDIDVNFIAGPITDSILVDVYIEDQKVLGIAATP
jgi:phage baseplate assembly protein W